MAPSKSIWHNHSLTAARGKMFHSFSHQSPLLRARGIAFSTSWSAKCLWGSVWGAFLISAPETCQGLRVSNQSCGLRRVTVRGRATGLLLPVCRVENYSSTRGEYLVLSKRLLEHFPPFGLTLHFHLQREALGVRCIIICSAYYNGARVIFNWLLHANQAWCENPAEPYRQAEHLISIHAFPA